MTETITNIVVLLACIMCVITMAHQFKPRLKRKPKRLFYVKLSGEYYTNFSSIFMHDNITHFGCKYKEKATELTDAEYDRIKHLLPNDHTLELVTDKK